MNILKTILQFTWESCQTILIFISTGFMILFPFTCGLFLVYEFGDSIDPGGILYTNYSGQLVKSGPMETFGGSFAAAMLFFVGVIIGAVILFIGAIIFSVLLQLLGSVVTMVRTKLSKKQDDIELLKKGD